LGGSLVALNGVALAQEREEMPAGISRWTRQTLTPFTGDAEFRRYLRTLDELAEARPPHPGPHRPIRFAQAEAAAGAQSDAPQAPVCEGDDPTCGGQEVVLTGARRAQSTSITNNQEAGVDEGDIVKQIGRFLLVLQDGRIFVADTRPGGQAGLTVTDRVNVYRNSDQDTWYDEMLVAGNRVLITGYSYQEEATELAVFRLDPRTGRLAREGTFYMSSNDYYDTENYASRIVGENLVVYTPINLDNIDIDTRFEWPVVRRWEAPGTRREAPRRGRPLLDARDVYRPVRDVTEPWLHTISVCPLTGGNLSCRTTGFVGPRDREFHVSTTDAYIWATDDEPDRAMNEPDCGAGVRPAAGETQRALLFRLPLLDAEAEPGVIGVSGRPIDYLSLDTGGGRFRALVRWQNLRCGRQDNTTYPLTYFDTGLDRFDATLRDVPDRLYTPVPSVGVDQIENRFTDGWLVYGGRRYYGSYPPEAQGTEPNLAAAVPFVRPAAAQVIQLPHSVLRVEQAGDNVVLTGYRDESGLDVSLLDLRTAPRLASTAHLPGRYETEGRSHAFNSQIEADGSGPMGVPTTRRTSQSGRWWSYSEASDVSFLVTDATGRLAPLGELLAHANGPDSDRADDQIDDDGVWDDYNCEVSCIDWYGNSRPIFTDGRIFGLAGSELIEGWIDSGRIREVRRLNMTVGPIRQP
jgi:hypothetical protein